MIWQRLLVHSNNTIADLHHILQRAMGWIDAHLHQRNLLAVLRKRTRRAVFVRDHYCADAHVFVTASHELSREYREYERTSTTVANAYVGPVVSQYLGIWSDASSREASAAA